MAQSRDCSEQKHDSHPGTAWWLTVTVAAETHCTGSLVKVNVVSLSFSSGLADNFKNSPWETEHKPRREKGKHWKWPVLHVLCVT